MERARSHSLTKPWLTGVALALASLAAPVVTAFAQQAAPAQSPGGRYRVLVPTLEHPAELKDDFGKAVAEGLRKQINKLNTHAPVDNAEVRQALRKFRLKEEELDCVKSRQLAVQIGAELVMCGMYQPAGQAMQVAARVIGAKSGDTFEVPAFTAASASEAVTHIFNAFERYVSTLSLLRDCNDYLGSQQWRNALENCENALAINPTSLTALKAKGRALMELDSLEASLAAYKQVLEIDPAQNEALRSAGIVATKLGRPDEGRALFKQYLELNPGDVDVRLSLAAEQAKAGDAEGALRMTEEGLQTDSTNITLMEWAGHFALGVPQQLEQRARAGGSGSNGSVDPLPWYEKALGYYEKVYAAQGAETGVSVLRGMVSTLTQLGREREAVELGAKAVGAKPAEASLWSAYADALQKAGQLQLALAALDSVVVRDATYQAVTLRRAMWLLQAGQLEAARAAFEKGIQAEELKADDAAKLVYAYAYNEKYKKNQFDAALELFALTRQLAGTAETRGMASFWSGYIYYERGTALARQNTPAAAKSAVPIFQRALEFFDQSDAYLRSEPSLRPRLQQMVSYMRQFIDAVNKQP